MYMVVVLEDGVLANLLYEYVLFICIYTHTYVFFLNIYLDRPIGIGTPPASVICPAGLRCSFLPYILTNLTTVLPKRCRLCKFHNHDTFCVRRLCCW